MKRIIRTVVGTICAILLALVVIGFCEPFIERFKGRRALANAMPDDLETVVGRRGRVFRFGDGSWLAIHYQDSHGVPMWSFATARDSGGGWFESREHFCGSLGGRSGSDADEFETDAGRGLSEGLPPRGHREWIRLLEASPDLVTARERMKVYFSVLED